MFSRDSRSPARGKLQHWKGKNNFRRKPQTISIDKKLICLKHKKITFFLDLFPFKIFSEEYIPYLIKTSTLNRSSKHIPLLPLCCSKIIYIFALPDDFHYEDLFKKAEKFWMEIKSIKIIKESKIETGKYALIVYFHEEKTAEAFFHVMFLKKTFLFLIFLFYHRNSIVGL